MTIFDQHNFRPLTDVHQEYNADAQSDITDDGLFNPFFLQFVQGVPDFLETQREQVIGLFQKTSADCPELKQLYDKLQLCEHPWVSYSVGPHQIQQYKLEEQVFVVGADQEHGDMFHLFIKRNDFNHFNEIVTQFMEADIPPKEEEEFYTPPAQEPLYATSPTDGNPEKFRNIMAQGCLSLHNDDIDVAIDAFTAAIGFCEHDEYDKIEWIEDIIEYSEELKEANFADLYDHRGQRFAALGFHRQATKDYTKALRPDYVHEHVYFNRGLAYNALQEFPLAIEDFTKSMEMNPAAAWNYNARASCYSYMGQTDLAIADFKEGLVHAAAEPALHNNLAMALFDLGEFDEALQYYSRAIELAPDAIHMQINVAELLICASRYREALEWLEPNNVLLQSPHYPMVAETLRLILAYINQTDSRALEQALITAQQQGVFTGWSFKNIVRWFKQAKDLHGETREQIGKYLDIALSISVT